MYRLLPQPCLAVDSIAWINGPGARSSGTSTSMDGGEQTFDSYGDAVAVQLNFAPNRNTAARRQRGFLTAITPGNAFRLTYLDMDMPTPFETGVAIDKRKKWRDLDQLDWSNGDTWSDGQGWRASPNVVSVDASADLDGGIISLADEQWGHALGMGDHIGFGPFHFGIYTITEVIGDGVYRIWPRLRKSLTTEDFCTLRPTAIFRPIGKDHAQWTRLRTGLTAGSSLSAVEVPDYYVRQYYEG